MTRGHVFAPLPPFRLTSGLPRTQHAAVLIFKNAGRFVVSRLPLKLPDSSGQNTSWLLAYDHNPKVARQLTVRGHPRSRQAGVRKELAPRDVTARNRARGRSLEFQRKKVAARGGVRMPHLTLELATDHGTHYEVLDDARNVVGHIVASHTQMSALDAITAATAKTTDQTTDGCCVG
jgi:hypothetical protein